MWCTLSSFQGNANPNYQAGNLGAGSFGSIPSQVPVPGHKMPQVVGPTPAPKGFMPVSNEGVQRPGMGPMQPPGPTQSAPAPAAVAPAAPPPTVQTVDTSNVPGNILSTLTLIH